MLLGAFLHAGLPEDLLIAELSKIPDLDFDITVASDVRSGIGCKQVTVHSGSNQQFRHLENILETLQKSSLKSSILERAGRIFTRLAEAEASVHKVDITKIHFHEVGAVDTIVDIVGSLIAIEYFGIMEISCSPLPMGRGFVKCDHGNLPLPAPAVCELLRDIPVYGVEQDKELVTPTGAVLATQLADNFGMMPTMIVKKTGYGAGKNILDNEQPNLLRLLIGEKEIVEETQTVEIIECNLDDWNSEMFPHLSELLFNADALDVSLTPILMKKGRPGQRLQVISKPHKAFPLKQIILAETSAIGLRFRQESRMTLPRESVEVATSWGKIKAKQVHKPDGKIIYPEYEECRKIAQSENIPLERVYRAVIQAERKEK